MNEEQEAGSESLPLYEVQEVPLERRLLTDRRGTGRRLAVVEGRGGPAERRRHNDRRDRRENRGSGQGA